MQIYRRTVHSKQAGTVAISGAAMLLASAARGGQGTVTQAVMIRQHLRLTQAVYDASVAAQQARLLAEDTRARLVRLRDALPTPAPQRTGGASTIPTATATLDPEAQAILDRLTAGQAHDATRYGIDPHDAGDSPDDVRQLIRLRAERAERDRISADAERARAAAEEAEALRLLAHADQEEQRAAEARASAAHEPDAEERARAAAEAGQREASAERARADGRRAYDSAERRQGTARALEAKGIDGELVATRMRADVSQAKPATAAIEIAGKSNAPKGRKSRSRSVRVQRSGHGR